MRPGPIIKNVMVIIFSIVFALGLAELSLRYVGRLQKIHPVHKIQSGWGWEKSPLRYLQPHAASSEVNQLGLRGKAIKYSDEDFIVLLVGDSQVEAAASPFDQMPEALLQSRLSEITQKPIKVFSLASSGWGQDQQLLAIQEYFKSYRADLVLTWVTPINDFWENAFPDRSTKPQAGNIKPVFYDKNGKLEGPYYVGQFFYRHSALLQLIAEVVTGLNINQLILNRWESKLPAKTSLQKSEDCVGTLEIHQDEFFENIHSLDAKSQYTILSPEDLIGGRTHFSPQLTPKFPIERYQTQITQLLFEKMLETSKKHGAKFTVFYPIREDLNKRIGLIRCVKSYQGETFGFDPNYQKLITQIVPKDNLFIFPIGGRDEIVVSKKDRHLNAAGNKQVVEKLSERVFDIQSPQSSHLSLKDKSRQ